MKDLSAVTFDVVPAAHPDAIRAMSRYFEELNARFDVGFEPGETLTADAPFLFHRPLAAESLRELFEQSLVG